MKCSIWKLFSQTSKIRILHLPEDVGLSDKDSTKIYKHWKRISRSTKLYDGELCNFEHLRVFNYSVEIITRKLTYAAYLARQHVELRNSTRAAIRPLTVGAVTRTSDEKLIIGKRGNNIVAAKKIAPLPQGFVASDRTKDVMNPKEVLITRLHRELGISRLFVDRLMPGGLIQDEVYGHVMLIFFMYLRNKNSHEILPTWIESADHELNERIWFIDCTEDRIRDLLVEKYDKLTGDAVGSFLLFGRNEFGYEWYCDLIERLAKGNETSVKSLNSSKLLVQ